MLRRVIFCAAALTCCSAVVLAQHNSIVLPSGWRIEPPSGPVAIVGTMPQGIALSPDRSRLAVVESGVNPPALRVLDSSSLRDIRTVALPGAFGKPVWRDTTHVLVAGANGDALYDVDTDDGAFTTASLQKNAWPDAVALAPNGAAAVSNDGNGTVIVGSGPTLAAATAISVGSHPGDLIFSRDGNTLYAAMRGGRDVVVIQHGAIRQHIAVGLHPSALALSPDGAKLYVAVADDDNLVTIDTREQRVVARVSLRFRDRRLSQTGTSPNAIAVDTDGRVFVSCGAANAVAVVDPNGKVTQGPQIPVGWYPSGVAVAVGAHILYVANGKGEGAPPNPQFNPFRRDSRGYVASITVGSVRRIDVAALSSSATGKAAVNDALAEWQAPIHTVIHPHGPIQHVIYIIKENRSYDQVLGDIRGANGDSRLVQFGEKFTPNQHALARRFGVLDNAYTNSQVSADGHNWTDAAFANDYLERFWPNNYGDRRDLYDFQTGGAPVMPRNGYIWDAALKAHVSFRDYGEDIQFDPKTKTNRTTFSGLQGHFDPRFIGWNLNVPDSARFKAWHAEFTHFVAARNLPQLEIVYLPNDHTAGSKPGSPTPQAYVALNDYAVGEVIDTVSHSAYWRSTAVFIVEDDAQNGPDHVSDQRSTFYIASPYAVGGVHHAHYSTVSVVRTIELLLGLPALSVYDQTAQPLYDVFGVQPDARPFVAIQPRIDVRAINRRTAYGAATSARMNFNEPDAANARDLNDILAHVSATP